jgi:hypothetical protein|nr:MAG TPA: hypothetical protein [Caudoviricetes sp.]
MDEFTKIILSGTLMIQWVQLGLIIARSWDKESRQDKSITGVLTMVVSGTPMKKHWKLEYKKH